MLYRRFAWMMGAVICAAGCGLTLDLEPEPDASQSEVDFGTPRQNLGGFDAGPQRDANVTDDCTAEEDGRSCDFDGAEGVCIGGSCSPASCGDGFVTGAEACDDGNEIDGDGCQTDCTFSCEGAEDCTDLTTACATGVCIEGDCDLEPIADATCTTEGGEPGVCVDARCQSPDCGNGTREPDELCDDGNAIRGDGCDPDCTPSCATDGNCQNGVTCDGMERCVATGTGAACGPSTTVPMPTNECFYCDNATGGFERRDGDGDGYSPFVADGVDCGPLDCDDTNPNVYPGAPEIPANGIDDDCDGPVDEAVLDRTCWLDADGDTFGVSTETASPTDGTCPDGYVVPSREDCNDGLAAARPSQETFFSNEHCLDAGSCSYDYDCNGREERKYPDRAGCLFETEEECLAAPGGWGLVVPACGESGTWRTCIWTLAACRPSLTGTTRTQSCR